MMRWLRGPWDVAGRGALDGGGSPPGLSLPAGALAFFSPSDAYYNVGDVVTTDLNDFFVTDEDYGAYAPTQAELESEGGFGTWWTNTVAMSAALVTLLKNGGTGSTIIVDLEDVSSNPELDIFWTDAPSWTHRLQLWAKPDLGGTSGSVTAIQNDASFGGDSNYRNRINPASPTQKVGMTVTPTDQMISCHGEDAFVRSTTVTFANYADFVLYIGFTGEATIAAITIYPPKTAGQLKTLTA